MQRTDDTVRSDAPLSQQEAALRDDQRGGQRARPRAVTWRALLVGSIGAAIIGVGDPYGIHALRGSYMALDFSTPAALVLLFLIAAGMNGILRRFAPARAFRGGELATVYSMLVVASVVPSMGLTGQLLPMITAPFYYPSPGRPWIESVHRGLLDWLYVSDPVAVRSFYEGGRSAVFSWANWARPLLVWMAFILCLYFTMVCVAVILRRQWADRERLVYPLIRLPVELTQSGRAGIPLLRSSLFWMGFGCAFGLGSLTGLRHYLPSVPAPVMATAVPLFEGKYTLFLRLSLPMLGFFYLVNLDTLFSLWFFNLLFQAGTLTMTLLGIEWKENLGIFGSPSPLFAHVGMGAMIALIVMGALVGREHMAHVLRCALSRAERPADSGEALSYRFAFWGLVVGGVGMAVWLAWSGMPLTVIPLFLFGAFVLFVGLTRIVVESGLAEAVASTTPSAFVASAFGSTMIGPQGMVSLGLTYVWASDLRTSVLTSATHGLQLTQLNSPSAGSKRGLVPAMFLAIVIAVIASFWITFTLAHRRGGINLDQWFLVAGPQEPYKWVADAILNPAGPHLGGWLATGLGAATMVWLTVLRQSFTAWPLNPIGFAVGNIWITNHLLLTAFVAWLAKLLIVRYGGLRLFKAMTPLFLGLILGQYVCNAVWLLIDLACGGRGNQIFWI